MNAILRCVESETCEINACPWRYGIRADHFIQIRNMIDPITTYQERKRIYGRGFFRIECKQTLRTITLAEGGVDPFEEDNF